MKLPGFTAEMSLYETTERYWGGIGNAIGFGVNPAQYHNPMRGLLPGLPGTVQRRSPLLRGQRLPLLRGQLPLHLLRKAVPTPRMQLLPDLTRRRLLSRGGYSAFWLPSRS
jgi:hypothetical protein